MEKACIAFRNGDEIPTDVCIYCSSDSLHIVHSFNNNQHINFFGLARAFCLLILFVLGGPLSGNATTLAM